MTALRQSTIEELEKVPEDKLAIVIHFIQKVTENNGKHTGGSHGGINIYDEYW